MIHRADVQADGRSLFDIDYHEGKNSPISGEDATVYTMKVNGEAVEIVQPKVSWWSHVMPARDVGRMMGYDDEASFRRLITHLISTGVLFEPTHFVRLKLPTAGGDQLTLCLTYFGVAHAAMHSNAPNAEAFRSAIVDGMLTNLLLEGHRPDDMLPGRNQAAEWRRQKQVKLHDKLRRRSALRDEQQEIREARWLRDKLREEARVERMRLKKIATKERNRVRMREKARERRAAERQQKDSILGVGGDVCVSDGVSRGVVR